MAVKTNGKVTTEWWLTKVTMAVTAVYMIFLMVAKNVFEWEIPEQANQILAMLVGSSGLYVGGRSVFKSMLAKADVPIEKKKKAKKPTKSKKAKKTKK